MKEVTAAAEVSGTEWREVRQLAVSMRNTPTEDEAHQLLMLVMEKPHTLTGIKASIFKKLQPP